MGGKVNLVSKVSSCIPRARNLLTISEKLYRVLMAYSGLTLVLNGRYQLLWLVFINLSLYGLLKIMLNNS